MRVRVEIEVELHPQGDKEGDRIHSRVRAQATSRGLPNEKRLSAGLLRELQPTIESLRRDVHDAVIRRVAHDVYARNVTIHEGFSAWRPIPPNADDVREHPWWWSRIQSPCSHGNAYRIFHLQVRNGNVIDVEDADSLFEPESCDWTPVQMVNDEMWRSGLPTAAEVRGYSWWWNRAPDGRLDVILLKVRGKDVDYGLGHPLGEWAPCTPPPYPDPAR